ncbi:MAG: hypothetical protein QMD46_10355 [Methanomicrobiales archaeon]|nr:hypothetical protein [Methanomicrobiales archaeon]MDI6877070.1 hypothetical protein [Methanomicrobiales archaeon]
MQDQHVPGSTGERGNPHRTARRDLLAMPLKGTMIEGSVIGALDSQIVSERQPCGEDRSPPPAGPAGEV